MKIYNSLITQTYAFLLVILSPLFINALSATEPAEQPIRKAAIFVENRAGKAFDGKVPVLEDFITSRITEQGFSVLSREVLINAFKDYSTVGSMVSGANVPESKLEQQLSDDVYALKMMQAIGEMFFGSFKGISTEEPKVSAPEAPPVNLDQQLSRNSSALRLAQMMGADYIIAASITSFGMEKKAFEGYGVKTINIIHNLRISYKILEAVQGGSLVADTVKVSKTTRFTEGSHTEDTDMINELLDEASVKVAESLSKKRIIPPPPKPDLVEITVACGMQDLAQLPVSIPDVRLTKDNTVVIGENKLEVQLLDVTVELNGTVIGSAPGTFRTPPGLSKIRLSREGFRDWERTINVMAGQKLKVALQMSDAGYERWKDNTAFLQKLKNGEKLTDAAVKAIEGAAQMLRQSGFKIDAKADVKGEIKSIFRLFY
ncbi:MAG: PEGA domain-containing protein [Candidatus Brocadiaceae bacterium]|nr:PEGA domain-containing protein [Candidatus Brocadiaceae bacterium]